MSELLTALVAASKVGFDAPKCRRCKGSSLLACRDVGYAVWAHWVETGAVEASANSRPCPDCHATGLDASDPERLIGRAMAWLWSQKRNVTDDEYPNISAAIRDAETGCGMRGLKLVDDYAVKRHDGTPTGLAIALLRLVARVGGVA